jgi:hypothetical protein
VSQGGEAASTARRHSQFAANMQRDFRGVIVDEMTDAVMGDAAEVRPVPQRANRRLFVFRENPAATQADNIRELAFNARRGFRFHASGFPSTALPNDLHFLSQGENAIGEAYLFGAFNGDRRASVS